MFSSLRTAFYLISGLILIFTAGVEIAKDHAADKLFKLMNSISILHWFKDIDFTSMVGLWLIALALFAVFIFINAVCCSVRQINILQKMGNKKMRNYILVAVHIVTVVVLICHCCDVFIVQRYKPISFYEGDKKQIQSFEVKVAKINYVSNMDLIRTSKDGRPAKVMKLPIGQFDADNNYAKIEVYKDSKLVKQARIAMFDPLFYDGNEFLLDTYFVQHNDAKNRVGINIRYAKNPLVVEFFAVYGLLLCLFILQFFKKLKEKSNGVGRG